MNGHKMSPRDAEEWLGLKPSSQGRAFLAAAFRREQQLGTTFIIREGRGKGRRYLFTRESILRHMPEFAPDQMLVVANRIRTEIDRLKQQIDERIDRRIEHHPSIEKLKSQHLETAALLEELTKQVGRLVGDVS